MTTTRCAISATTPRSCVISTIAAPDFSFSARIRSRICAWMVTSSAVVGSSAMSRRGRHASAIAIITRWRMPPESWCGYSPARRSGSGMSTWRSMSTAPASASAPPRPRCTRSASAICRPTVSTGLSEVIGSWKIIEIALPRSARISSSSMWSRSRPSSRTAPPTIRPGGVGTRRIIDSAVMLLPQPDSPTIARISPRLSANEMPSTALTRPWRVKKTVRRSSTSRTAVAATVE